MKNRDATKPTQGGLRNTLHDMRLFVFAILLTAGLTLILSINLVRSAQVSAAVGEPIPNDVLAPISVSYTSNVLMQQAQEQARNNVQDVYTPLDLSIGRAQLAHTNAVFSFIDTTRADSQATLDQKINYLQDISGVTVDETVAYDLLTMGTDDYNEARLAILRIVDDLMREEIRESQLDDFQRLARRQASLGLTPAQSNVVTNLAWQFVTPTVFLDEEKTQADRTAAAEAVPPVVRNIVKDQRILRAGDIITDADFELLNQLGLLEQEANITYLASIFLISGLAVVLIVLYWRLYANPIQDNGRYLGILAGLILFFTLAAKGMTSSNVSFIPLLFPIAALSMLIAVIFDLRFAILITVIESTLFGLSGSNSLELTLYAAVGGLLAILTLRDFQRLVAFFQAGIIAALGYIAVLLFYALPDQFDVLTFLPNTLYAFGNGVLSAALTLAGFYILGALFGVITSLQLQDLSRLDHPLLQELLRRAPGTYHHSIMVANLAEQAAERVKANSTLVRVGAFYHDIGKMNRPAFFTENQEGINPHDSLDAYTSARIIINHVADGLELAKRYRLPDRIRDFIAQHHGTRVVKGFYYKAREQAGDEADQVDMEQFRYPGPRPYSRETGIVMMADVIEATSSALRPNTSAAIEKLVNSLVNDDIMEGQLNRSGLSMGDIEKIRLSFIETLKGRFHVRVKYPGNEQLEIAEATRPALPQPDPQAGTAVSPPVSGSAGNGNPLVRQPQDISS